MGGLGAWVGGVVVVAAAVAAVEVVVAAVATFVDVGPMGGRMSTSDGGSAGMRDGSHVKEHGVTDHALSRVHRG